MLLKYKGVLFDDWVDTEIKKGTRQMWSEMCQTHVEEYCNILGNKIDYEGSACGSCGVCGCSAVGDDESVCMYYVDFNIDEVDLVES